MTERTNPRPNSEPNDSTKPHKARLITTWLRIYAETMKMREDEELTESKIRSYIELLSTLSLDELKIALFRAGQECSWFPSVGEIRDRTFMPVSEERIEAARQRLAQRYEQHYLDHGPPKSLPSVIDDEIKQEAAKSLKLLSPAEYTKYCRELKAKVKA